MAILDYTLHYVDEERKTAEDFIKMIDDKYIKSKGFNAWLKLVRQYEWIKPNE